MYDCMRFPLQVPVYSKLADFVEGSVVGELANDSRNVVELVRDNYNVSIPVLYS